MGLRISSVVSSPWNRSFQTFDFVFGSSYWCSRAAPRALSPLRFLQAAFLGIVSALARRWTAPPTHTCSLASFACGNARYNAVNRKAADFSARISGQVHAHRNFSPCTIDPRRLQEKMPLECLDWSSRRT